MLCSSSHREQKRYFCETTVYTIKNCFGLHINNLVVFCADDIAALRPADCRNVLNAEQKKETSGGVKKILKTM